MPSDSAADKCNVLIICTGNTCRSPMAQAILEQMVRDRGLEGQIRVCSAGLMSVLPGQPASCLAHIVCAGHGLDLSGHRSRPVSDRLLESADLILVMERFHLDLLGENPRIQGKDIRLLSRFDPEPGLDPDIADPYGGEKGLYEDAFRRIRRSLEGVMDFLLGKREND